MAAAPQCLQTFVTLLRNARDRETYGGPKFPSSNSRGRPSAGFVASGPIQQHFVYIEDIMRKTILITSAVLTLAGVAMFLVSRGSNHTVVVGNEPSASAEDTPLMPFDKVDHSAWDRLLKKYVDENGLVNYTAWKASGEDTSALKVYLAALGHGDPEAATTKEGRLAFWINAYNAVTVYGILDVYPTSSIRNHTAKLVGYNIWRDLQLPVAGQKYSLEDMEHKILRKLREPRIHFAIVCASIGCPRLLNEAYTDVKLEAQLADNTRDFFSRPEHFRVDVAKRAVYVSPILDWFGDDFAPTPQQRLQKLAEYLRANDSIRRLIEQGDFSVSYLDYDWNLNDQRLETTQRASDDRSSGSDQ